MRTKFLENVRLQCYLMNPIEMQKFEEKRKKMVLYEQISVKKKIFVLNRNPKINKRPVPNKSVLCGKFIQNYLPSRDAYSVR